MGKGKGVRERAARDAQIESSRPFWLESGGGVVRVLTGHVRAVSRVPAGDSMCRAAAS